MAAIRVILAVSAYSFLVLLAGVVVGDWASDHLIGTQVVNQVRGSWLGRRMRERRVRRQLVRWRPVARNPNLHAIEIAEIELAPFETYGAGGAIEEIDGHIVFASPLGQLGELGPDHVMRELPTRVPMNLDVLRGRPIFNDPKFTPPFFRLLDLLVVPTGPQSHDLYASHHRFIDGCIEVAVSRTTIRTEGDRLVPAPEGWEHVFSAKPCMFVDEGPEPWEGLESGGRMVMRDESHMLLSLGDHALNGVRNPNISVPQDPAYDLGKIIEIDLRTQESRIYATGMRNPQGLMIARDGTIWETEHGPQGGDEINIIREGGNYGWPRVTYGTDYGGFPGRPWPLDPVSGRHDGYEPPVFAFVPSIGISNIVQPDPREFPLWEDHLLLASLKGRTLFVLRIEPDDRVAYAEPVSFADNRLRDIIVLADGRIAILSHTLKLFLLRNGDRSTERASPSETEFEVVLDPEVEIHVDEKREQERTPEERGQQLFAAECAACHGLNGAIGPGPPLDGVVGREVGGVPEFGYSPALAAHDGVWTRRRLVRFLVDSSGEIEGAAMQPVELTRAQANSIVDYLETL